MLQQDELITSSALQDRRSEPREATVFRPVLIDAEGFASFCLVRNLSPTGMRAKVYSAFAIDTALVIQFSESELIAGTLIWQKDDHIGVRFEQPIDVSDVLATISKKGARGKLNRALRLSIDCKGELELGGRTLSIEVLDISQRGLKIRTSFLRPGDEVSVRLASLDQRKAIVRWTQPGSAGLNFVRPLSFDELGQWVVSQQMGGDRHDALQAGDIRCW